MMLKLVFVFIPDMTQYILSAFVSVVLYIFVITSDTP